MSKKEVEDRIREGLISLRYVRNLLRESKEVTEEHRSESIEKLNKAARAFESAIYGLKAEEEKRRIHKEIAEGKREPIMRE